MMNDALLLMAGVLRCAVGFDTYFCYGIIYRYGGIFNLARYSYYSSSSRGEKGAAPKNTFPPDDRRADAMDE
jgi:hypothetical protein